MGTMARSATGVEQPHERPVGVAAVAAGVTQHPGVGRLVAAANQPRVVSLSWVPV
jgi:hypothetical protein